VFDVELIVIQMLVVEWPIEDESQLNEYKNSMNMEDFIWSDGLAPPLKDVRRRRFRKRLSNRVSCRRCCFCRRSYTRDLSCMNIA
jgi:TATA-binding protein-associated factor Taf7